MQRYFLVLSPTMIASSSPGGDDSPRDGSTHISKQKNNGKDRDSLGVFAPPPPPGLKTADRMGGLSPLCQRDMPHTGRTGRGRHGTVTLPGEGEGTAVVVKSASRRRPRPAPSGASRQIAVAADESTERGWFSSILSGRPAGRPTQGCTAPTDHHSA